MTAVVSEVPEATEGGLVELAKDGAMVLDVAAEPGARPSATGKFAMENCDNALIDLGVDTDVDGPRLKLCT